jgi:hypothetical protein
MAYFGNYYVPEGASGSTPGSVPSTQDSVTKTFVGQNAPFMGLQPPLTYGRDSFTKDTKVTDANGKVVIGSQADAIWKAWQVEEAKRKAAAEVSQPAADPYAPAGGDPTKPTGADQDAAVGKLIDASNVAPPDYKRLADALGAPPKPVTLDTAAADQARGQQQANIADLQRAAAGQGPAAELARARLAQALRRSGAQTAGLVLGATGQNRKAGLLQAALAGNEAALNAGEQVAAIEAQDRQQAQAQLTGALQGVRGQDLGQAGAAAGVAAGNEDRALNAAQFGAKYAVELEDLRLRVGGFQTQAAQGVLNEASRQEGIRMARRGLALAEERLRKIDLPAAERAQANADREFWLRAIAALTAAVVPFVAGTPGGGANGGYAEPAKLARGGLVTQPTHALIGEAGPELVIPVNPDVSGRLAQALATENKPFDRQEAPDLSALLALLKGGQQAQPAPQLDPRLIALLAAGNARARKAY